MLVHLVALSSPQLLLLLSCRASRGPAEPIRPETATAVDATTDVWERFSQIVISSG